MAGDGAAAGTSATPRGPRAHPPVGSGTLEVGSAVDVDVDGRGGDDGRADDGRLDVDADDRAGPAWPDGGGGPLPGDPSWRAQQRTARVVVDLVVLVACVAFTAWHLQPDLLLTDSTPAGGDMGAHVWGPAYLRDNLLPQGQVAGWTGAWYAGFPAYQFYMVVPSLLIVALNVGLHGWAALAPAAVGLGCVAVAVRRRRERQPRNLAIAGAVVAFGLVGLPYGVAFKLVSVSGLVTLPVAAYVFGRLAGARFPTPAVLAVATLPFLFYRGFTIYGGNVASTLAGEFAFSMSLSIAVVYLGVVFKGLETGRYRALAAVLLALTGLCHLIPAFWALGATAVVLAVRFRLANDRLASGLPALVAGLFAAVVGLGLALVAGGALATAGLVLAALGGLAVLAGVWIVSDSARWLAPVMVVGGLLSMWWVGPFFLRRAYLNDMGWEKLPYDDPEMSRPSEWAQHLFPHATPDVDLRWAFGLAVLGAALSVVLRLRIGIFLLVATVGTGVAFVVTPEGRLWNGRLLPFYYLTVLLLAAVAVSEIVRTIADVVRNGRPAPRGAGAPLALAALAVVVVLVGVPMGQLPYTQTIENGFAWPSFSPWRVRSQPASFVPGWAKWNYSGYEGKVAYREYYGIVTTMAQLGEQKGCGRAFWEYEKELDRYGTPMALMLLPHWTDGCIGSMEGLYFEASATTPFHFLTQVELSTAPSAAQRDLPYGQFDINKGVDHLQMMGVRYYMATSDNAVAQARAHADLTEVAASGPWVVFEVADSEVVSPLANQPAVVGGIDDSQVDWVERPLDESGRFGGPAVGWFNDPARWAVPLASGGPDDWQRVAVGDTPDEVALDPVEVSNPVVTEDGVSFDVDQVGVPVLVKMSYFPNWRASGADGPYRVAPNFMVVIPNDTHVELTYGRTGVEWLSYALTLLGVVGLVLLLRRPPARFAADGGRGGRTDDADGLGPAGDPADRAGDGTGDRSGAEPDGAEAPG
jgi:6-pyruvoyl-tetrahydropterin synthase related domain